MTVLESLPARLRAIRKLSPACRNHVVSAHALNHILRSQSQRLRGDLERGVFGIVAGPPEFGLSLSTCDDLM
jgi:hypothetical protein